MKTQNNTRQNKTELDKAYCDFIQSKSPYAYFVTLTFILPQSESYCRQQLNELLHRLNQKLFKRNYDTEYLTGFVFAEYHKTKNENLHYHLLIADHENFHLSDKKSFHKHFTERLKTIKSRNKNILAFDIKNCDLQSVYYEPNIIDYLTKSFNMTFDPSFILPLSKTGIDHFMPQYPTTNWRSIQ